jgi:hypothetical protein
VTAEPGENDPIGIILCSEKSDTVVRYAMGGIGGLRPRRARLRFTGPGHDTATPPRSANCRS